MLWVLIRSASASGASNEYPQHMFLLSNKKDISIFRMKKVPYLLLCFRKGLLYRKVNVKSQLPFLNQRKRENDHIIYFMINLHKRMLPDSAGIEPEMS